MTLVSPGSSSRLLCYYLDVALEALNRNHVCKNSCLVWSAFWCVSSREKEWIICPSSIPASAWAIYWHNNQEQRHVINSSTGEGIKLFGLRELRSKFLLPQLWFLEWNLDVHEFNYSFGRYLKQEHMVSFEKCCIFPKNDKHNITTFNCSFHE